jgi:AcrR family transcriptional regulator
VTINDTCGAARLNKRYFYESFSTVDALVEATLVDACDAFAHRVFERVEEGAGLADFVRVYVEVFLDFPDLVRLTLLEPFGPGGSLASHRDAVLKHAFSMTAVFGLEGIEPVRLQALMHAATGAAAHLMNAWMAGRLDLSRDALHDAAVEILLRILDVVPQQCPASAPSDP